MNRQNGRGRRKEESGKGIDRIVPDKTKGTHSNGLKLRISDVLLSDMLLEHQAWKRDKHTPASDLKGSAEYLRTNEFRHRENNSKAAIKATQDRSK